MENINRVKILNDLLNIEQQFSLIPEHQKIDIKLQIADYILEIIEARQEKTTELVGYFKMPSKQGGVINLFFRIDGNTFHWCPCHPHICRLEELRFGTNIKVFSQEPELELYQAKTWKEAKKWFHQ
jgi:hypothetical protein